MDANFWHERWQNNELGFHLEDPHPLLQQCLGAVLPGKHKVLVPLCGKSPDLHYLAGYLPVVGAELSAIACNDFFAERSIPFEQWQAHEFVCYHSDTIRLWQGDFFALTPEQIVGCNLVYDRAALIALPPAMRAQYAAKLQQLLPSNSTILLISLEYPKHEKQGPPFSVTHTEIEQLFSGAEIECLARLDLTGKGFAKRRFTTTSLVETAYRITLP